MAAVQFSGGKLHGAAEAKAMMRHADADERLKHEHSNKDIDKSKTELNTSLYDLSYKEMCDLYDQRVQQYQNNATRKLRSNAVTLLDAIVSVPTDLDDALTDAWISDVVQKINNHYKADVVLDAKIHRDEIHDYIDPSTHKTVTSRVHAHIFIFPEVSGRLNCRDFTNRKNMTSLNREIDKMTHNLYNCRFLTGEQTVDRDFLTVEQLKRKSDNAALMKQTRKLKAAKRDASEELESIQKLLHDVELQLNQALRQLNQIKSENRTSDHTLNLSWIGNRCRTVNRILKFDLCHTLQSRITQFLLIIKYHIREKDTTSLNIAFLGRTKKSCQSLMVIVRLHNRLIKFLCQQTSHLPF